ncbi:hypothetical protein V493_04541 [Pseudogymnoascus sp. VKM F-4281 (FW-2241)]|nr:hypothetical protein V493_04541 [Pseudogymnoascus sp. VKM F-4281 (FW-2241)]
MADRLTQLQDAVDQLAHQFVASIYYVHRHHELTPVNATDKPRDGPMDSDGIEPYPTGQFIDGQRELAKDLIVREQQIELLISALPGLEHSEQNQQERIKALEEELEKEEQKRQAAVKEKDVLLARLDEVIRSVRRP